VKLTFTQSTISKFKIRSFFILFLCFFISGCGQLSLKENPETLNNQQTSHYAKSEFNKFESPNQYTYGEDKGSSNLTFNTANKNEMDVVMSLVIIIFLFVVFTALVKASKIKPHPYWKEKEEEAPQVATETIQLKEVDTSLMLKRGEVAYFDISFKLSETRAERNSLTVGAAKKIKKGPFAFGALGTAKSHQVLTPIDEGKLTLTNKRLVFIGPKTNKDIKLNKIISVLIKKGLFKDQLKISVAGRQTKTMHFSGPDKHRLLRCKDEILKASSNIEV